MARQKTQRFRYQWSNGSYHSRPEKKQSESPGYTPTGPMTNAFGGPLGAGAAIAANSPLAGGSPTSGAAGKPGSVKPPAPKPAPKPPVQPLDPDVVNAQNIALRNIGIGDAYATFQQGNLDQEYGFGAGGAANPYSRAALLQENFKRSQLGTTNSYGASGQLYSGAYDRAQNENTRNYSIGYDQLRRQYDQQTGQIGFDRLQNYADAGTAVDDTSFQALLRALGKL